MSNIVVGDIHLVQESPYHQTVPIERIVTHPGYSRRIMTNDIALVKLARPVAMNDYVRPVCLDLQTEEDVTEKYTKCYVAGWGFTEYKGEPSICNKSGFQTVRNVQTRPDLMSFC